jgi:hypothetical protein
MAEEKKDAFPWIQLIATVGTIIAAFIGITPYLLKLNTSAPQTPTIVFVTFPPATTTPTPVTTPVTPVETTPAPTQTTIVTTIATTGPPLTGNETPVPTTENVTAIPTTPPTTLPPATTTLPQGPAIQISVNVTSVTQGGVILTSVSTDPGIPQVIITLRNSTTFESQPVNLALTQGKVDLSLDTSPYAPGDYLISAAIPDTQAVAQASFVITAA